MSLLDSLKYHRYWKHGNLGHTRWFTVTVYHPAVTCMTMASSQAADNFWFSWLHKYYVHMTANSISCTGWTNSPVTNIQIFLHFVKGPNGYKSDGHLGHFFHAFKQFQNSEESTAFNTDVFQGQGRCHTVPWQWHQKRHGNEVQNAVTKTESFWKMPQMLKFKPKSSYP